MKHLDVKLQQDLEKCFRSFIRYASVKLPEHTYLIIVPELRIASNGNILFSAKALQYSNLRTAQKMFERNYTMPSFNRLAMLFTKTCIVPIDVIIPNWEEILDEELYPACC